MEDADGVDEEEETHRSTLVLRLRRPSRSSLEERLARLESVSFDHEERLKFLDPELKATHSRIDVVESVCDANTSALLKLRNTESNVIFDSVVYNSQSSCYSRDQD